MVTSEVMAVGDLSSLSNLTASISLSREDVLDLSALSQDLVIDQAFSRIWDANNPSRMIEVTGYEQIVGGAGDDVLIAAGGDPFGLAGGAGHDQLLGGPDDILRYDLEEAYRSAGKRRLQKGRFRCPHRCPTVGECSQVYPAEPLRHQYQLVCQGNGFPQLSSSLVEPETTF